MELNDMNSAGGRASKIGSHPDVRNSERNRSVTPRQPGGARNSYRLRAEEAAEFERRESWVAAADAWMDALAVAAGENVRWCRDRNAWCLARSQKPVR